MKDPFNCLPHDVIVMIFSKIAEAKTLCMTSMVSTKFAALTFQTKEITIKIPTSLTPPNNIDQNQLLRTQIINFLSKPLHHFFNVQPQTQIIISMSSPSVTPPYFQQVAKFLAKFSSVETLTISIPSTNNNVLKWTGRAKPSEHFVGFMVVFGNNNNNNNSNNKEYLRRGCYQLSVVLIGYECLWTIVANSRGNMDKLKCAVIKDSQQNDTGKLDVVVDEACMAVMKTSRPEVVRMCQRIKTFGIFGQVWDLPAAAAADDDDDDGFQEIKAVSFTGPTNIRETVAFEVEERKILESFGDVNRSNLVPCFITLR